MATIVSRGPAALRRQQARADLLVLCHQDVAKVATNFGEYLVAPQNPVRGKVHTEAPTNKIVRAFLQNRKSAQLFMGWQCPVALHRQQATADVFVRQQEMEKVATILGERHEMLLAGAAHAQNAIREKVHVEASINEIIRTSLQNRRSSQLFVGWRCPAAKRHL